MVIISHKTRHPYAGPAYDLHESASLWIETHLRVDGQRLFASENIFFEISKDAKLARIASEGCDIFIDDLPEIISSNAFPSSTKGLLFAPSLSIPPPEDRVCLRAWSEFLSLVKAESCHA
jgi:hypothetical protein